MVGISINTNQGALIALQELNKTNQLLEKTLQNITTGIKVTPRSDPSTFAIALSLKSDVAGIEAVRSALDGGQSITDVALVAATAIGDILIEMKALAVKASQQGLDQTARDAIIADYDAQQDQLDSIVAAAEFNGTNLLESGASDLSVLSAVASDGTVSFITVSAQDLTASTLDVVRGGGVDLTDADTSALAIATIDGAIDVLAAAVTELGSSSKQIAIQVDFTTKLKDILKVGIGNLIDSDLAEESAKLQALQIQQQLGAQALSIANASPQIILALFS